MQRETGGAPQLSVAAVARRLGVAPATLRTWDRRYGLGPSGHAAGAHRRYSGTDLARLIVMRRLTIDGVAPVEAAQIAREARDDDLFDPLAAAPPLAPVLTDPVAADALVDAVLAADDEAAQRLLALPRGGDVLEWWGMIVEPARIAMARRTVVERPGVSGVDVLESAALAALRGAVPAASTGQPVALVLAPAVRPRLIPVHTVAAALAVRGVDARVVTGNPSARHVVELVAMTRASVAITVLEPPASDVSAVERLAREWPDVPQFVVASDAMADLVPLGRSVVRARTLAGVVHETLAAIGFTGTG